MDATLLGNLVAYSAQVALLVLVGAGLAALVRVDAAGVRYVYWRALLALCLILPWLPVRRSVVVTIADTVPIALLPSSSLPVGAQTALVPAGVTDWVSLLGWVIVAGVVLRLCWVGLGLWRLRRLSRVGTIAAPCVIHEEAQDLVRARAEIRYVSSGQPVTFGFRRPVVLLPEMLRAQPAQIQQLVLCHELFHVRRRDWIWVVAEEIVKAALWFHPAVMWLIARVRLAREEVVDELTVLATAQRRAYIEALLVFADTPSQAPAPAFARRRHLFRRMVLISKETVMSSKRILVSVATMTAVIAAGAWSAVSVFPLTEVVIAQGRAGAPAPPLAAVAGLSQVGPIERQAKPITPENPIPRRTFSVAPQNPAVEAGGVVVVSVRVVVDRQGRVAEARSAGVGLGWIFSDEPHRTGIFQKAGGEPAFHFRIGRLDGLHFRFSWLETVPLYSSGRFFDVGVGAHPGRLWDFYAGVVAGGPFDGPGLTLKLERRIQEHLTLAGNARFGYSGFEPQNGFALSIGYISASPVEPEPGMREPRRPMGSAWGLAPRPAKADSLAHRGNRENE